ncbi:MAG: hypothetical protein WB564_01205 [Dehalococcoidia bacterium]
MQNIAKITLYPSHKKQGYVPIYRAWWNLFPSTTTQLELEAKPMGVIHTQFYVEAKGSHHGFSTNLRPWFNAHPELKAGDELIIEVIEQMNRYRLKIA